MASNVTWYAGPCIKRAEKGTASHLEAVAQLVNSEWKLIEDPKILFRGMNDVELRAADARQLRVLDWAAFTIGNKAFRTKSWPATAHRRLYRYKDLSALGGAEETQRQLVVEGIQMRHAAGTWIVRCAEDEALQVELREHEGVAHLALGNGLVSAYRFDSASVIRMPTPDGEVDLYDLQGATAAKFYDWTPDDSFALRVVRAAVDAGDSQARSLVSWLESHAKQAEGLLHVKSSDIAAANEALRAGKLAKRLATDQELLQNYLDALVDDERIGALIKEGAERIAEQERAGARVRAEAMAMREIEVSRKQGLAALKEELADAARNGRKALSEDLAKLRADGEAELQRTVSARIDAMEKRTGELDAHCKALAVEADHATAAIVEERQKAESVRSETAEAQALLDAINVSAATAKVELAAVQSRLTAARTKCPVIDASRAAKLLTLDEVRAEIETTPLLSNSGKTLMAHFLALTLAGEVPVLCGPGVDDFLLAAEILFGGGRSVRMEGDPTILTFEDLWIRAGTDLRTGFGQALAIASGIEGEPRMMLAALERAERSGARFWYPTLADRAQRGTLPRSLLICVTVADHECEEALEILSRAVRLDLYDVLQAGSSVPLAMIAASAGTATELDTEFERANVALGAATVANDAPQLGAARSLRAMRAVAEATSLCPPAHLSDLAQLFLSTGGKPASANKPRRDTHA